MFELKKVGKQIYKFLILDFLRLFPFNSANHAQLLAEARNKKGSGINAEPRRNNTIDLATNAAAAAPAAAAAAAAAAGAKDVQHLQSETSFQFQAAPPEAFSEENTPRDSNAAAAAAAAGDDGDEYKQLRKTESSIFGSATRLKRSLFTFLLISFFLSLSISFFSKLALLTAFPLAWRSYLEFIKATTTTAKRATTACCNRRRRPPPPSVRAQALCLPLRIR